MSSLFLSSSICDTFPFGVQIAWRFKCLPVFIFYENDDPVFFRNAIVSQLNVKRMKYDAVLTAVGTEPKFFFSCNANIISLTEIASLLHIVEMYFRPSKIV